jgi:hypothetical protein
MDCLWRLTQNRASRAGSICQKEELMNEIPEALIEKVLKWRNFKRERPAVIEVPGPGQEVGLGLPPSASR